MLMIFNERIDILDQKMMSPTYLRTYIHTYENRRNKTKSERERQNTQRQRERKREGWWRIDQRSDGHAAPYHHHTTPRLVTSVSPPLPHHHQHHHCTTTTTTTTTYHPIQKAPLCTLCLKIFSAQEPCFRYYATSTTPYLNYSLQIHT